METRELLTDAFTRVRELYEEVVADLDDERLHERPSLAGGPAGNSIAWLLWHLARVQDDHVAGLADAGQAWHDGWSDRFDLPLAPDDTGFGHTDSQVDSVRIPDAELLSAYHAEVHRRTLDYLDRVDADELGRVVDRRWDPPVTAGVRLVSIEGDCLQHLGQAAYLKGLLRG